MAEKNRATIYGKRYRIERKLYTRRSGNLFLVTDLQSNNEEKMLKVIPVFGLDSKECAELVEKVRHIERLENEFIVKFYESFLDNDYLCIVTEYCDGGSLEERLQELKKQNQMLEEDQVVEWLIQILIAVQYMHKSSILHRNLKPKTIFLKNNRVKIGDFGISRVLAGVMDVATTFTGTPYYMSPEVMKHEGYGTKSDIWAVGCLLYTMCMRRPPFEGKAIMEVQRKVLRGTTPDLVIHYSKELNDLYRRMLNKAPSLRPTASDILQTRFIMRHSQRNQATSNNERQRSSAKPGAEDQDNEAETTPNKADQQLATNNESGTLASSDRVNELLNSVNNFHPALSSEQPPRRMLPRLFRTSPSFKFRNISSTENPDGDRSDTPTQIKPKVIPSIARADKGETARSASATSNDQTLPLDSSVLQNIEQTIVDPCEVPSAIVSAQTERECSSPATKDVTIAVETAPHLTTSLEHNETDQLRKRGIELFGVETFERLYEYVLKQRMAQKNDTTLTDERIKDGLIDMTNIRASLVLIEQLISLRIN